MIMARAKSLGVRFGSKADMIAFPRDVRFAPESGHVQRNSAWAKGYEAVANCLASLEVRARTAGTIAWRPTS
jgi:hypothetical protein